MRRITLAVCLLSAACSPGASSGPGSNPPDATGTPTVSLAPVVEGVFARSEGGEGLLIDELFIAFDGTRVRAGARMLQAPQPGDAVEAKLCNVHLDTQVVWTRTGFVVSDTVDADGTIGVITIDAETNGYSFNGSNCNVQLASGHYGVTAQRDADGNVIGILLTPPEGAAEEWRASELMEIKDYASATWRAGTD